MAVFASAFPPWPVFGCAGVGQTPLQKVFIECLDELCQGAGEGADSKSMACWRS
jgi:hypothetical protein